MKIRSLLIIAVLALAILFSGVAVKAQTTDVQALIAQIQAQIVQLTAQLQALQSQQSATPAWCHTFNTNLRFGVTGSEVNALGTALAKELAGPQAMSGDSKFDEQIASAVTAFQEKYASEILTPNGLSHGTGYAGPVTRAKLNALYGCETTTSPIIVINSISGTNSLNVGQTGNWTVNATAPSGTTLIYHVDWGDNTTINSNSSMSEQAPLTSQNSGFSHAYAQAGTYTVKFTVNEQAKNSHQVQGSIIVVVENVTQTSITVLSPNGGEGWTIGTTQTIKWNFQWSPQMNVDPMANIRLQIFDKSSGQPLGYSFPIGDVSMRKSVALESYSYNWIIPPSFSNTMVSENFPNSNHVYKIYIKAITITSEHGTPDYVSDNSNTPFSIVAPMACVTNWVCNAWSTCINGTQVRTCIDGNNCGSTIDQPVLSRTCAATTTNQCTIDSDCNPILCLVAPCPRAVCNNGVCGISTTQSSTSLNVSQNVLASIVDTIARIAAEIQTMLNK